MSTDIEPIAWHEAGHAVAYVALGLPFRYVTIGPGAKDYTGQVAVRPARRRGDFLAWAAAAGPLAERAYYVEVWGEDESTAERLAEWLGCARDDHRKIRECLGDDGKEEAYAAAASLFFPPLWSAVEAVAQRLLNSRKTLGLTETKAIVANSLGVAR
jgi:hypothetical protein